jgi:hypothetical protein
MTNDERKAIERAQAALSTLTPATARDDAIAFDLRCTSATIEVCANLGR